MKGFLLDTNHVGQVVRPNSPLWEPIYVAKKRGLKVGTCIPVLGEVESGRQNVARRDLYILGLERLLRAIRLWPLSRLTAEYFGQIDQDLRRRGRHCPKSISSSRPSVAKCI
jgi:predicted nucleic acid-binding protein